MLLNLNDFKREASDHLDDMTLAYYTSGADDEQTVRENRTAWQMMRLRPRSFVDVSVIDTTTTVLGHDISFPVLIPPMAFQQLAHPLGETELASAAGDAETIYCLSTISNIPMKKVVESTRAPVWFQLYVDRERSRALDLVERAELSGCQALVVTVDTPVLGNRERDVRLGFRMPSHLCLPNLPQQGKALTKVSSDPNSALANFAQESLDPSLTWKDLDQFASQTTLPIIVKGVLGGEMVVVGLLGGRKIEVNLGALLQKRLQIRGTVLRSRPLEEKIQLAQQFKKHILPLFVQGKLQSTVDVIFSLEEVAKAHVFMESNRSYGKIVLQV